MLVLLPLHAWAQGPDPAPAFSLDEAMEVLPEAYFEEALAQGAACAGNPFRAAHVDCTCVAQAFFRERVERGPEVAAPSILLSIAAQCPNEAGRAGWMYGRCLDAGVLMAPRGVGPEEFCTCVATRYARLYNGVRGGPSSRATVAVQAQAMASCVMNPPTDIDQP